MSISKLNEYTTIELYKLTNAMMRESQNILDASTAGQEKFTCVNGWILHYLYNNRNRDIFQKDIEREFSITRSTASKIIRLMEQKNLIEGKKIPEDARLKKLERTEKAKGYRAVMKDVMDAQEERMFKDFSDEERKQFFEYVQRIRKNLSE